MGTSNYSNLLSQKSKKFFTDLSNNNPSQIIYYNYKDLSEKIQLKVSIKQIKKECIYKIRLFNIINNEKKPLNEIVDCSPQDDEEVILNTPIITWFFFEKEQPLFIEISKESPELSKNSEIKTTMGCIMGSRKNTWEKEIFPSESEKLIIQAEKLKENEEKLNIIFDIIPQKKKVSFSEMKYKMYYEVFSDNILYRSECLNDKGIFNIVKIPLSFFKNNNIKIIFYKSNRKIRGDFDLTVDEFIKGKDFDMRVNGVYFKIISKSKLKKDYTFVDYLKAGLEVGLSVAIDFTGSNGSPDNPSSLHYIYGPEPNQYERAINSCGKIVSFYDYDQKFPCFGFGAKINNQSFQLFNLNLQKDPNIQYVEGIIEAYHNAIKKVKLYGPTFFGPIIREMNKIIKLENNKSKYHILMILTDGIIDDIDSTIDELVEASFLPISVIIIGVGNADFNSMNILDADDNPLISSKGVKAARDLVQFVPFLKYESNNEKLANEVLEEIPRQVIDYYEQNNLDPMKISFHK